MTAVTIRMNRYINPYFHWTNSQYTERCNKYSHSEQKSDGDYSSQRSSRGLNNDLTTTEARPRLTARSPLYSREIARTWKRHS